MGEKNSSLLDNDYFLMIGSFVVGIVVSQLMSQKKVIKEGKDDDAEGDLNKVEKDEKVLGLSGGTWALIFAGAMIVLFFIGSLAQKALNKSK